MQIKNFQAPTIQDALDLVRRDFGKEAVILKTDVVREAGRRMFSVTAAKDFQTEPLITAAKTNTATPVPQAVEPNSSINGSRLEAALLDVVLPELLKGELKVFYLALRAHDVEAEIALDICRQLQKTGNHSRDALAAILSAIAPQAIDLPEDATNLVFVGPCGSGKSSLLAKYATDFVFQRKEKITLQTLDNFRPGAEEEISNLTDILELACGSAGHKSKGTRSRHLIDTTGLVVGEQSTRDTLTAELDQVAQRFTILVLPLTTGWNQLRRSIDFFTPLRIDAVAFTQLDAADSCGALINLSTGSYPPLLCLSDSRLPTSMITEFDIKNYLAKFIGGVDA